GHMAIRYATTNLKEVLQSSGNRSAIEALDLEEVQIAMRHRHLDASIVADWLELARQQAALNQTSEAISSFERACALAKESGAPQRRSFAAKCSEMGRSLRSQHLLSAATEVYREAVALREPLEDDATADLWLAQANDLHSLGLVLEEANNPAEAEQSIRSA